MPLMHDNYGFSGMGFPFGDLFDEQPRRQQRRPVHGHPFFGYQGQDEDDMYHPSRRQQQEQQIRAQREQMRLRNQQRQQVLQQRAMREQALRERAAHEQAMREQYMLQQQQVQEQLMRQRQEQELLRQRVQEQSEDSDDSVSFVSDHSEEVMPELMPLDEEMASVSDFHDCVEAVPEPVPVHETTAASEPGPVETVRHEPVNELSEPEEQPVEMPAAEEDFVDAMSEEPENKHVEPVLEEAPEEQEEEEEEPTSPALTPEQLESQQKIEKVNTSATALTEQWKSAFTALGSDETENERIKMNRMHYEEGLLQLELKLDNVMTHGSMKVRTARKQTINSIEGCISTLKDFAKLYDRKQ